MLTRKDFQAIADIIRENRKCMNAEKHIAEMFADYLATKNPKFDREKFLKACGI